jgi:hypothetical protein
MRFALTGRCGVGPPGRSPIAAPRVTPAGARSRRVAPGFGLQKSAEYAYDVSPREEAFEEIRPDLVRLFALVEVDPNPTFDQTEPFVLIGFQPPTLLFRGESLALLRALQTAVAGSALARGGPSRKAVEGLLTKACSTSVVEGADKAIAWIRAELAEPPARWLFVESIPAYLPKQELQLGSCRLARDVPADTVPEPLVPRLR